MRNITDINVDYNKEDINDSSFFTMSKDFLKKDYMEGHVYANHKHSENRRDEIKKDNKNIRKQLYNADISYVKNTITRFCNSHEIDNILYNRFKDYPYFKKLSEIPHPKELHNNMQAAKLVCESIAKNEKIIIVGDYDTDGICATTIMLDFFELLGYNNVSYAIPNRFNHGYGFSEKLFKELIKKHKDIALIITVDNGVSSFEAAKLCKEKNIKLIITDHHRLEVDEHGEERKPECRFLINPQQKECYFPFKDICGALVAWYFCCAIRMLIQQNFLESSSPLKFQRNKKYLSLYKENLSRSDIRTLLIFVGIAIISDVMPLNAINYSVCHYAIQQLNSSEIPAFIVMKEYFKCLIDSQMLGFKVIPLLNAAGRVDDGIVALKFLRSKKIPEAHYFFKQLKYFNKHRKVLQKKVLYEAFKSLQEIPQNPHITFAVGKNWHEGVLGIVAGKMVDEFCKPSFVLSNVDGNCKGSARSCDDIDLIASMQHVSHLPERYGGHVSAIGIEIKFENIPSFIENFRPVYSNKKHIINNTQSSISNDNEIIGELTIDLINYETFLCIAKYEPYGNGNSVPKFFFELEILEYKRTSQGFFEFKFVENRVDSNISKSFQLHVIKAMLFNTKYAMLECNKGEILQFSATLSIDSQKFGVKYGLQNTYSLRDVSSLIKQNNINVKHQMQDIMLIIDKIYGIRS